MADGRAGPFDAVVLAGGRAVRAGGIDKLGQQVGGRTLVASVVSAAASAGAARVIVAGPHRAELVGAVPRPPGGLLFVQEEPPGSGPVPALRAALAEVSAPVVVLLAGDLPFLTARHLTPLLDAVSGGATLDAATLDAAAGGGGAAGSETGVGEAGGGSLAGGAAGALLLDDEDRAQWLASCWRVAVLSGALAGYRGRSLHGLLHPLRPVRLACPRAPGEPPPWLDCDTAEELALARRLAGERNVPAGKRNVPAGKRNVPAGGRDGMVEARRPPDGPECWTREREG